MSGIDGAALASILAGSADPTLLLTPECVIAACNSAAESLFGISSLHARGQSIAILDPSGAHDYRQAAAVAASGGAVECESEYVRRDGSHVELAVRLTPVRDGDGAVAGVWCAVRDVTERKRAEHVTAPLAAIVESSDDAIIGKTLQGEITSWNPAAEQIYGYSAAEAVGRHVSMLLAPGQEDELTGLLARVARGERVSHLETTRRRSDGRVIDVSLTVSPVRDSEGRIVAASTIARDVSRRKQAERARERALADLEDAQRIAQVGSWSWDPDRNELSWSPQMYAILGRDPRLGPAGVRDVLTYVHRDDRERVGDAYAYVLGGHPAFEVECRIIAGEHLERTVHALGCADRTHPGSWRGTVQDVTRDRRSERERLDLMHATARAESANLAKSEFLARMSHELRTPLNSIIGFGQVLQLEGLGPRQSEDIGHILSAGNHLLALVNEVLDLARIESGQMTISSEPIALADTIRDAVALAAALAEERNVRVAIDTDGLADDGHVHADRNRFKQVLLNLLSNAIKYNRPSGRVDISFQIDEPTRVRTIIADTGIGIHPENLARLFEPFERLGAEHTGVEGTGLGLALSKRLIEAMNGTVTVHSVPGVGTTVAIELESAEPPVAEDQVTTDRELAQLGDAEGPRPLILYIEDNLSNLTLVERILERQANVELISAMQGGLGLDLARQHRPDLIVLDLHLPDIPGTDVLTRLKASRLTRPIPVVVLTADASGRESERVRRLGAAHYLTKPIDLPMFLEVIAENLGAQARPTRPGFEATDG